MRKTQTPLHIVIYIYDMQGYIKRKLFQRIFKQLDFFPAVALLGPRQCGKSTLVKAIIRHFKNEVVFLDLENPRDLAKIQDPQLFLEYSRNKLVCLDEVQRMPQIFEILRVEIDADRRPGRFLLTGSASRDLVEQSSESLAGRIAYEDLGPFSVEEILTESIEVNTIWFRGGFPDSLLAKNDEQSIEWRFQYLRSLLERDIPALNMRLDIARIERLVQLISSQHGEILNGAKLGEILGQSAQTSRSHLQLLEKVGLIQILHPWLENPGKRLIKSPKVYLRDSGLFHSLASIDSFEQLLGNIMIGNSWEGFVLEQLTLCAPRWKRHFYRTSAGAEIDFILSAGSQKLAFECKSSSNPKVSRGFYNCLEDLGIEKGYVVAPVDSAFPISPRVTVIPIQELHTLF